jgi:hypothetical protein
MRTTKLFALVAVAAGLAAASSPTPASAETGGAGILPASFSLPEAYKQSHDEANGLRLVKPPGTLTYNRSGEAGAIRFYAGVNFRRASRRLGVTKVRVSLLGNGGSHLISQCTVKAPRKTLTRQVYLDRLGSGRGEQPAGAGSGESYVIRYTVFRDGQRIKRDFPVSVPAA